MRPYKPPSNPEIICYTDQESIEKSVKKILFYLEKHNFLPSNVTREIDISEIEAEEKFIREYLRSLGFARESW